MADKGYYHNPTLFGDRIVFVCEDDLWEVSTKGGVARRLTANPGRVLTAVFSGDGERLAFTGRDEGTDEVYVMPAAGGPAERLTFLGANTQVVGWTPGGRHRVCEQQRGTLFPPFQALRRPGNGRRACTVAHGSGLEPLLRPGRRDGHRA